MIYFTLAELTASVTARARGIDNTPPEDARHNLVSLTEHILDPLRRAWGKPVIVNSGYRCPALNRAVGGVAGSSHLYGRAADITTGNSVDNRRLYQLVIDMKLPFFELIGKKYDFQWLHISYNPQRTQRQPC